jgi:hypothetical protein
MSGAQRAGACPPAHDNDAVRREVCWRRSCRRNPRWSGRRLNGVATLRITAARLGEAGRDPPHQGPAAGVMSAAVGTADVPRMRASKHGRYGEPGRIRREGGLLARCPTVTTSGDAVPHETCLVASRRGLGQARLGLAPVRSTAALCDTSMLRGCRSPCSPDTPSTTPGAWMPPCGSRRQRSHGSLRGGACFT